MSAEKMREALKLADAALSGANMNMNVVRRKIAEALAEKPAQGEVVAAVATAYIERQRLDGSWDMVARFTAPADPSSPDGLPRDGIKLYTAPPAPAPSVPDAKHYEGRDVWTRAYVLGWNDLREHILAAAPEAPR